MKKNYAKLSLTDALTHHALPLARNQRFLFSLGIWIHSSQRTRVRGHVGPGTRSGPPIRGWCHHKDRTSREPAGEGTSRSWPRWGEQSAAGTSLSGTSWSCPGQWISRPWIDFRWAQRSSPLQPTTADHLTYAIQIQRVNSGLTWVSPTKSSKNKLGKFQFGECSIKYCQTSEKTIQLDHGINDQDKSCSVTRFMLGGWFNSRNWSTDSLLLATF